MYRTLKPGGQIYLLDMVVPENPILRFLHGIYLRTVLPTVGRIVLGSSWPKGYLRQTIENFGNAAQFVTVLEQAGFKAVRSEKILGGIAVLFSAKK